MKTITLNNGVEIPILGFGTYQITDPKEAEKAVIDAIQAGYRHIDTAQSYLNEQAVGLGIANSGVPREEIFLTTIFMALGAHWKNFKRRKKSVQLVFLTLL